MDEKLEARVVATLKLMGIAAIPNFNILDASASKLVPGESAEARTTRNLHTEARRLQKNVDKAKNRWASKWYQGMLRLADAKLQKEKTQGPPQEGQQRPESEEAQPSSTDGGSGGWQVVTQRKRQGERPPPADGPTSENGMETPGTGKEVGPETDQHSPNNTKNAAGQNDTTSPTATNETVSEETRMHD